MRKLILLLYLLFTIVTHASAQVFRNEEYHYSIIKPPPEWKQCPQELLDSLQKRYYLKYDASFSTQEGLFKPPYIVLYTTKRGPITQYTFFENIDYYLNENYYGEDRQFEIKNFSQMVFDPAQNEFVIDTIKDAGFLYYKFFDKEDKEERKQLAAIYIGSEWITYIWAVSVPDEFERLLPIFKEVVGSFEYEDDFRFYYSGNRIYPYIQTQNYTSKAYRFGFSYPFGWKKIPEGEYKNNRRFLGGFCLDDDSDLPKIEIRIHFDELEAYTFPENAKKYIRKISGKNRYKKAEYMEISQVDLENVKEVTIIDTIKNAVYHFDERKISKEEVCKVIQGVFIGWRHAVFISCTAKADEFDTFLPIFKLVLDSFEYFPREGYSYAGIWYNILKVITSKEVIALFTVLVFVVVFRLLRRRRNR